MKSLLIHFSLVASIACAPILSASETINLNFEEGPSIAISYSKFEDKNHQVTFCGDDYACLIDGKPFWGTDGKIPQEKINHIKFTYNKFATELDVTGMYDPLVDVSDKTRIKVVHYYGDSWKVRGRFSDGAGSYFVEWLVTKNGSMRTAIGDSESLYDMFHSWFDQ